MKSNGEPKILPTPICGVKDIEQLVAHLVVLDSDEDHTMFPQMADNRIKKMKKISWRKYRKIVQRRQAERAAAAQAVKSS